MTRGTIALMMIMAASAHAQSAAPAPSTRPAPVLSPVLSPELTPAVAPAPATVDPTLPLATTRPAQRSAEETLRQMLQPQQQGAQPITPQPTEQGPGVDATSGAAAVAPDAPTQRLAREGTLLHDRVGRLTKSPSGWWEMRFDSDGSGFADPPLLVLPNRKLMQLEDTVKTSYRDLKVWVSGEVTEYRGRNYLLLHRWSAVPDSAQPLQ